MYFLHNKLSSILKVSLIFSSLEICSYFWTLYCNHRCLHCPDYRALRSSTSYSNTHLLYVTNSIGQIPFFEVAISSATQETPNILWILGLHYRLHKSLQDVRGWVGSRNGVDAVKNKIIFPLPRVEPVARRYADSYFFAASWKIRQVFGTPQRGRSVRPSELRDSTLFRLASLPSVRIHPCDIGWLLRTL